MNVMRASALFCLFLSATAWGGAFDDAAAGNWNTPATWGGAPTDPTPIAGDTVTIDGYKVDVNIDLTTVNQPAQINLNGGQFWLVQGAALPSDTRTIGSPITAGGSAIIGGDLHDGWANTWMVLNGLLSGAGELIKQGPTTVVLSTNNYGTFTGSWRVEQGTLRTDVDGGLGNSAITVVGGTLLYGADQTAGNGPASITVSSGGAVVGGNSRTSAWNITLNGGKIGSNGSDKSTYAGGTITLSGDNLFRSDDGGKVVINSPMTGSGTLSFGPGGNNKFYGAQLGGDNSGYNGAITVPVGYTLWPAHANALGGGSVTVQGTLDLVNMTSNMAGNVTLDGGTLMVSGEEKSVTIDSTAVITLARDSTITYSPKGALTVNGQITQSGGDRKLTLTGATTNWMMHGNVSQVYLTNSANDYAGGTDINFGPAGDRTPRDGRYEVYVTAPALGSGAVNLYNSRLITQPADAATSVFSGVLAVNVRGGMLVLQSTENQGKIHVYEGGALDASAGATSMTYGAGGNVHVHTNAILPEDWEAVRGFLFPTALEIEGGGQIYKGLRATPAASYALGGVFRGVSTLDANITIGSATAITEAAPGTGIDLYAQDLRAITLDGAALSTSGAVNLYGGGPKGRISGAYAGFQLSGAANFDGMTGTKVMNMEADTRVYVKDAGGIPADARLNVNNGFLMLGDGGAVAGRVDVGADGMFNLDQTLAGGTFNVGGAVRTDASVKFGAGIINWNAGSQLVMAGQIFNTLIPTNGNVTFLPGYWDISNNDIQVAQGFVLSEGSRISTPIGVLRATVGITADSGDITLVDGSSYARISPATGYGLGVNNRVNIPGKTLIIGDSNTFKAARIEGVAYATVGQAGTVSLANTGNQIGTIWIQAGQLNISVGGAGALGRLGNASEVRVDSGAKMYFDDHAWDMSVTFSGTGTVQAKNPPNDGRTVRVLGARDGLGAHLGGVSPGVGTDPGILTFNGGLAFQSTSYGGVDMEYARVTINVKQHAGAPGVAHDQVKMTNGTFGDGYGPMSNADLQVVLALPGAALKPADLATAALPIVSGPIGAGAFHDVRMSADRHWSFNPVGAVMYDAAGQQILLNGSALAWNAMEGDADLSNECDYLDLGILAGNYRKAVAGWGQADFDFSGTVDYLDLGALAGNYRKTFTPGGEGAPVPEPATLSLLALAGLGLIRRRQ